MNVPMEQPYGCCDGGGMGFANNPLLWLITLGFLGRGFGLGGYGTGGVGGLVGADLTATADAAAISNSAKIDVLGQRLTDMESCNQAAALTSSINGVAKGICDSTYALKTSIDTVASEGFRNTASLQSALAACCCQQQLGQKDIINAICHQTSDLLAAGGANTQKIIDVINGNRILEITEKLNDVKTQNAIMAQTATLAGLIQSTCGGK